MRIAVKASDRYGKFQSVLGGPRHRIALSPEEGINAGLNKDMLLVRIAPDPALEAPGVVILYSYDDTMVVLARLRAIDF